MYRFLKLVPVLLAVVQRRRQGAEQAVNRQTALHTLRLLCRSFGAEHPQPFGPVLRAAVKLIAPEEEEERNVLGSALLCVAEAASALEALAIPQLPRYAEGASSTHRNVIPQCLFASKQLHKIRFVKELIFSSNWKIEHSQLPL